MQVYQMPMEVSPLSFTVYFKVKPNSSFYIFYNESFPTFWNHRFLPKMLNNWCLYVWTVIQFRFGNFLEICGYRTKKFHRTTKLLFLGIIHSIITNVPCWECEDLHLSEIWLHNFPNSFSVFLKSENFLSHSHSHLLNGMSK